MKCVVCGKVKREFEGDGIVDSCKCKPSADELRQNFQSQYDPELEKVKKAKNCPLQDSFGCPDCEFWMDGGCKLIAGLNSLAMIATELENIDSAIRGYHP